MIPVQSLPSDMENVSYRQVQKGHDIQNARHLYPTHFFEHQLKDLLYCILLTICNQSHHNTLLLFSHSCHALQYTNIVEKKECQKVESSLEEK